MGLQRAVPWRAWSQPWLALGHGRAFGPGVRASTLAPAWAIDAASDPGPASKPPGMPPKVVGPEPGQHPHILYPVLTASTAPENF
jgi:hypothetical protein